jgi:hypothetical protein
MRLKKTGVIETHIHGTSHISDLVDNRGLVSNLLRDIPLLQLNLQGTGYDLIANDGIVDT